MINNNVQMLIRSCTYGFLMISSVHAQQVLDLEQGAQNFVLETKEINIPGFAHAFNSSIIKWRNNILLCFRVRDEHMVSTFEIGFVWLDGQFNPVSRPCIATIRGKNPSSFSQNQDPRLIELNGQLYILYSNFIHIEDIVTRRMFIARVISEQDQFFIEDPVCVHPFSGWTKRWEKNWVPFVYNNNLLLAYSLLPHRILQPSLISGECADISSTQSSIVWDWGELRGGTPAVLDGDEYIAFFHSSIKLPTVHSGGKSMPHYMMGAYTFSAKPPFEITRISAQPIVGKGFYNGPAYNTWKPLRVVFPMGCIVDHDYIWVSYGRQDFETWIVKLDKKGLYESLVSCNLLKMPFKNVQSLCNNYADIQQHYSNNDQQEQLEDVAYIQQEYS